MSAACVLPWQPATSTSSGARPTQASHQMSSPGAERPSRHPKPRAIGNLSGRLSRSSSPGWGRAGFSLMRRSLISMLTMIFGQARLPPDVYPTRPPEPAEDPFRLPAKVRRADRAGSVSAISREKRLTKRRRLLNSRCRRAERRWWAQEGTMKRKNQHGVAITEAAAALTILLPLIFVIRFAAREAGYA